MTDQATIRALHQMLDLPAVAGFLSRNADYFLATEGRPPDPAMATGFFADDPPGCDPAFSQHLGLFIAGDLAGLASFSFGFPDMTAAYLALMILSAPSRGQGHGVVLLTQVAAVARTQQATHLYLAVRDDNLRGRAFWQREGFMATGQSGADHQGHLLHRLVRPL